MSRYSAYVRTAGQLIADYNFSLPFHHYARNFFREYKKSGSTDRKNILRLCYAWFRVKHALPPDFSANISKALFLTDHQPSALMEALDPALNRDITLPVSEKLNRFGIEVDQLFPFNDLLSSQLDLEGFGYALLQQPDLFFRVRNHKSEKIRAQLSAAGINFTEPSRDAIAVNNGTHLESLLQFNKDVVVQDLSSQQTLNNINPALFSSPMPDVWDCCAASGGKSILIYDLLKGKLRLSVSDSRATIVTNLRKRLAEARVPVQDIRVADARKENTFGSFDLIICDAPCSGSGTWSRTPEQMHAFKKEQLENYTQLQQQILQAVAKHLKPGGFLQYITCSVFAAENETQSAQLAASTSLQLIKDEYIIGYHHRADTLYTALFRKPQH